MDSGFVIITIIILTLSIISLLLELYKYKKELKQTREYLYNTEKELSLVYQKIRELKNNNDFNSYKCFREKEIMKKEFNDFNKDILKEIIVFRDDFKEYIKKDN